MLSVLPNDPKWLQRAFSDLGLRELPGRQHSARVLEMFKRAGHPEIKDDETAWCSAAENAWMEESDIKGTGALNARSWLKWGRELDILKKIPRGAVLIFQRGNSSWQGHVCNLLEDRGAHLVVIGGNQSDGVTVAIMPRAALIGARWPDTAGNSVVLRRLGYSAFGEMGEKAAGTAAEHLDDNADAIGEAIGQAQSTVEQYATVLRIAQYVLIALTIAALGFAAWRFYARHLRPRNEPVIPDDVQPLAAGDVEDLMPAAPRVIRRMRASRAKRKAG